MWLASETGPLSHPARLAISDLWGGPFAEQLRGVIRHLQRQLEPWVDHLLRFHGALDQAASEADMAVRVEAAGGVPTYDIFAALAPWKAWPLYRRHSPLAGRRRVPEVEPASCTSIPTGPGSS